jgi:uncharacterized protein HemX
VVSVLNKFLAILATIAAALAVFFGVRSKQFKAEAARDRQSAEIVDAVNATNQRANEALHETEQRHRQEQIDSDKRLASGKRDHLEEHW